MTLEGRILELLDEIKYQKRFPPREAAGLLKNEMALQGLGRSGALVKQICGVYVETVEEILEAFSDTVAVKASALGLSGEADVRQVLAAAHEQMFNAARGLVLDELGGLAGDFRAFALASIDSRRGEVWQHLERKIRLRALTEVPPEKGKKSGRRFTLFLSHAAADAHMAKLLKQEIEKRVPGVWVFLSSDPSDLPPGTRWPEEIQRTLQETDLLVLLATSRSLSRPWVWFEAGTMWFTGRRLIPLCVGSIRKGALPPPLAERQALNADDAVDLGLLLSEIAKTAGLEVGDPDVGQLIQKLAAEEEKAATILAEAVGGWGGVEWRDRFLSYDGPIESLRLIEDAVFEQSMAEALEEGEYQPRLARPDNVGRYAEEGHRLIYVTDRRSWRRRITRGDVVLIARPLRWELQLSPDRQGLLTIEGRTVRLDRGALAAYQGADSSQKRRFRRHAMASPRDAFDEPAVREVIR